MPLTASIIVAVTLLIVLGTAYKSLLPIGSDSNGPAFAWPHGQVLLLGCFCFVLFLAEGSVLDWSGVFLTSVRRVATAHAGFAYVAFSTAMTVCRLIGDSIVRAVGSARVVLFGSLLAAAGFLLAILVPSTAIVIWVSASLASAHQTWCPSCSPPPGVRPPCRQIWRFLR